MKKRLLYLLKVYGLTVLLFIVAKWAFMCFDGSGHDVRPSDYLSVVWHGLSLDLSTALYIVAIPLLATGASLWVKVPRLVFKVYYGVIAAALALAFVADTSLYPFWGFKLDASCLQYLSQPEGLTQSVSLGYLLLRLLFIAILALLIYRCYTHISISNSKVPTLRQRLLQSGVYVLLLPLMVIGMRGGLSESTTNIGQVYYTQNQFLNHSAVNPVFSFLASLAHQTGDLSVYQFMDEADCRQRLEGVYTTDSQLTDTLLTTTRPRRIVIILLESAGEQFAQAMPHLQQLKTEGISFAQCYANSWRTDRGTLCALSGYPSFPTLSVMKMPQKSQTLPGIAATLAAEGYKTTYLYGGDINFTNMRSYLISTGWQRLISMDDYSREERTSAKWGVRDDITFATLRQLLTQTDGEQLVGYSTLSSHEPWDVPTHTLSDEVMNAFAYLDACLYQFVEDLRQSPQWAETLLILTADHGINHADIGPSTPLRKNHIPMLWLGGVVKQPRTVDIICNQTDLPATLLGQLQIGHRDYAFSRDVLSATYSHPVAVHNYNNAQWIIDTTGHLLYDLDAHRPIISETTVPDSLVLLNKAILQATSNDLKQR